MRHPLHQIWFDVFTPGQKVKLSVPENHLYAQKGIGLVSGEYRVLGLRTFDEGKPREEIRVKVTGVLNPNEYELPAHEMLQLAWDDHQVREAHFKATKMLWKQHKVAMEAQGFDFTVGKINQHIGIAMDEVNAAYKEKNGKPAFIRYNVPWWFEFEEVETNSTALILEAALNVLNNGNNQHAKAEVEKLFGKKRDTIEYILDDCFKGTVWGFNNETLRWNYSHVHKSCGDYVLNYIQETTHRTRAERLSERLFSVQARNQGVLAKLWQHVEALSDHNDKIEGKLRASERELEIAREKCGNPNWFFSAMDKIGIHSPVVSNQPGTGEFTAEIGGERFVIRTAGKKVVHLELAGRQLYPAVTWEQIDDTLKRLEKAGLTGIEFNTHQPTIEMEGWGSTSRIPHGNPTYHTTLTFGQLAQMELETRDHNVSEIRLNGKKVWSKDSPVEEKQPRHQQECKYQGLDKIPLKCNRVGITSKIKAESIVQEALKSENRKFISDLVNYLKEGEQSETFEVGDRVIVDIGDGSRLTGIVKELLKPCLDVLCLHRDSIICVRVEDNNRWITDWICAPSTLTNCMKGVVADFGTQDSWRRIEKSLKLVEEEKNGTDKCKEKFPGKLTDGATEIKVGKMLIGQATLHLNLDEYEHIHEGDVVCMETRLKFTVVGSERKGFQMGFNVRRRQDEISRDEPLEAPFWVAAHRLQAACPATRIAWLGRRLQSALKRKS